tara:strand:+ start:44 stop:325 length:282 start_codon:yes stop_codon:yes gene_type:complete
MIYTLEAIKMLAGRRNANPRCYAVLDESGERVGTVRRTRGRGAWSLSIKQRQFNPTPGSTAERIGVRNAPCKSFKTVAAVRTFLKNPEFAVPR